MAHLYDGTVPEGPPDLCFDSQAFVKDTFSVDEFLQEHRTGGNLDVMRDDLGVYLKVLRSAMIDLINKDYADYVNLSSNLIGLDKAIENIYDPLSELKMELLRVQEHVESAVKDMTKKLERRTMLREIKRSLKALSRVQTSLKKLRILLAGETGDLQSLERAAAEYSQLQFNSKRSYHLMSEQEKQLYSQTGDQLLHCIDQRFLKCIREREKGVKDLSATLLLYLKINKLEHAERFYRSKVVTSIVQPVINEENLRSLPRGLPALYEKILSFIDGEMRFIMEVTSPSGVYPGLHNYDFLLRSFWPEVEERLEINLTSIYAAGDPDIFFMRYNETLHFLKELGKRLKTPEITESWQNSQSFTSFMEKWNLPVYFQIRFQEIVKGVERSFVEYYEMSDSNEWQLKLVETIWSSINRCWDDSVFIMPIAHKFLKLTFQILSRFHCWVKETLKNKSLLVKNNKISFSSFLVYLFLDIQHLSKKVEELDGLIKAKLTPISENMSSSLFKCLEDSVEALSGELSVLEQALVADVVAECCPALHQVAEIPRLYRRTNREPPTQACLYSQALIAPPTTFAKLHADQTPRASKWLASIFSDVTNQYYNSVADVLTSVQKTEESLRRLKKARDRNSSNISFNERRDDDKIRLQLLLDVKAYVQGVEKLGVKINSIEKLQELQLLVETTQKL